MFKKETYINRRQQLARDVDKGILLFIGNSESPMNYPDNTYRYRQDSSFNYFFGLIHPDLAAIIDVESGEEVIYGDDYTIDHIVWMGNQPSIKERASSCGINKTANTAQLVQDLQKAQTARRPIHFLPLYRGDSKIKLFEYLGIKPSEIPEKHSLEFVKAVIKQRNYKSAEEVAEIDKACDITVDMHLAAMRSTHPGILEAQVAAEVEKIALAHDGCVSFPVIATINGQTLHNHYHGNTIQDGQMFLLDAGAETASGYAGDMSSTFPVGKTFTTRQKEIYQVALNAHEAAIAMLKPGIPFKEVYYESAREVLRGMKDLGFVKGDVHEAAAAGAHAMFFPCGLGHMMGMDVHDMEDLGEQYVGYDNEEKSTQFGPKSLRLGRKLEPGFVLTIEPGIYFIPQLIDLWKKERRFEEFLNYDKINEYRDFGGCRNEEDFLITEDAYQLLGKPLPKTIKDVESERLKAF
ncbi:MULTISPECIES: aminopeptidase P family protein [unclassified Lentimicrobium]|uniref:aminopeptidase P family protein n=1 Tax=unclassified Lentimicrobium TaxID=2677434 RepID=UPI001554E506|nr:MULTISPECIES: aminopeptidase P family protein [unclassified Lentimicrobium]NPD44036.1 aminopeptidase P family protein [Lentimicrobium sp. S6]NPD84050.1 aminopeptidase P family protein [Lentimicrobium sp. L6]